jgi:outer membrane lipoprotein SlyB
MKNMLAALAVAALAACSTTSPTSSEACAAPVASAGRHRAVRPVVVGSQSGIGAATGGVVGGVAGSTVGGHNEQIVVGVLGAVAGAVIANAVERMGTREEAVEIMVQLRNGERRSIVQAKGNEALQPGEAVILVSTNGKTRVSRAPAVVPGPKS